ncbi:MAG: hypothetical protein HY895_04960 [Deltaproteobacteria bacterium]|nr:hypothetical protein [Deltaproteobacteria bacterium]
MIMVLMALDHASFFVAKTHSHEFWGTAMPWYDSAMPFLLRAVTHLCAPGFFLLMGVGMALFIAARTMEGWGSWRVIRFFLIRGILLIAFQQFLENPSWYLGSLGTATGAFTSRGGPIPGGGASAKFYLGVLYGLGSTMLVWGLLFRLPTLAVIALSIAAIGLTQVVIFEFADPQAIYPPFLRMLLVPGHTDEWIVFYPTMPWMGITGLGMVLGRRILCEHAGVVRGLWVSGAGALVLFIIIRLLDGFGNFHRAAPGWIGFFNLTKYPPDLSFLLLTTGIDLLLLWSWMRLDSRNPSWGRAMAVFGSSPLFFYIVHLYLYALMGWAFPRGMGLARMTLFWLAGLLIIYPLCLRFGRFKQSRPTDSLWRLL